MNIEDNYNRWLNSSKVSQHIKDQLKAMKPEEKADAFFKDVEFGTAGMRGVLGPGTNRLNDFTIRKATVGFAIYLIEKYENAKTQGVVISHDNRFFSREFTLLSAEILNDFGIKVYIFDSLRPTPELSFAVRELKACGGIMITASHNPKEYNGYKVYDENGCQLVPSKISRLVDIINSLPNELDVEYTPLLDRGELITLDSSIDDKYVELVESIELNKDLDKSNFKIVFTPNHGTSYVNAMRIFKDLNYQVIPVVSQCNPDPNFSNTLSPNPEDERSFIEPLKVARENHADLVVMTDPDGDRVGLAYLGVDNDYHTLTGNQSAAMLIDYILSYHKNNHSLDKNSVIYNTIVTSLLGEKIANSYGINVESFLTGFKFIGDRIDYYEKHNGPKFLFGYEESYGCLISPFARDKDGCQAILMYSEMAVYYKNHGLTLDQVYDKLMKKYGYYEDIVYSKEFKGPTGLQMMKDITSSIRENPFITLNDKKVIKVEDYLKQVRIDNKGKQTKIDLPKSDVLKLYFEDDSTIAIRPSGTEPKMKFYIGVITSLKEESEKKNKKLYQSLLDLLKI
ncbi:MAG: phospho-sugar mutase [Bacilli bacterium]